MNRVLISGLLALAGTGGAFASSILTLSDTPAASDRSITLVGEVAARSIETRPLRAETSPDTTPDHTAVHVVSPSVVAYGAAAIPVARDASSSDVDEDSGLVASWRDDQLPILIRGGIVGDSLPEAPAEASPQPAEDTPTQPAE